MRTGDAWFLTMSNKELSACTVCVGPGECPRVCTTVCELALSRQNEGKRAARGLGSEVSPASKPGTNVCVVALPTSVCFVFI